MFCFLREELREEFVVSHRGKLREELVISHREELVVFPQRGA